MARRLSITWLGHSAFLLVLPSGARIAIDPWLDNPECPARFRSPESIGRLDGILLSHGHDDHAGGVVALARASGATVVCAFELAQHLTRRGVSRAMDMGIGGSVMLGDVQIAMTPAAHSSSAQSQGSAEYLGAAAGFVLSGAGMPTIYFAGDTGLFGDMKMIAEVYSPAIAFLPIDGRYTMGPAHAATAARWLAVRQVVPMHWRALMPAGTGLVEALRGHLSGTGIEVLELSPGETAE